MEKIGVFVLGEGRGRESVILQAGLTGAQTYAPVEGTGRHEIGDAIGLELLPKGARFLTALPMNFMGQDEEQIRSSASNFAKWGKPPEGLSILKGLMDTFVLDSGNLRQPGGTGKSFDWNKAVPIAEGMRLGGVKLVVAGGLTPQNVGEAMGILKPWGVDVVSGVEARPGKKDPEKVRAFVRAVRESDRKVS
jgi:phosphoribosylanthranilate isomerase